MNSVESTDSPVPAGGDAQPSAPTGDIQTEADIRALVDTFYDAVNRDELLGPIFNDFAEVDWAEHLPKMYAFWSAMLFRTPGYRGKPWLKHEPLPVNKSHFERWVALFCGTVDRLFAGPKASEAKSAALSIADTFQTRMGIFNPYLYKQNSGGKPNPLKIIAAEPVEAKTGR